MKAQRVAAFGARLIFVALAFTDPAAARAAATNCPEHFANGTAPDLVNAKLEPKTHLLCFQQFAVLHSGVTRTPLYSAEHLTRQRVAAAKELERPDANAFHPEPRLPAEERAELNDYKRSGLDRGHMLGEHGTPGA